MEYKWTALTVTTVGTVMAGIDSRIVIVGLPTIAQQLQTGPVELIWITQSFLLASTVCLLFIGRLSDLFGRVKLYNYGFLIFTFGSFLCAISPNAYLLIGFRLLQGVGSGLILANSSAIVTDASPPKELGMMLGINNSALRAGAMAGLTLSGLILSVLDWRGLFYINIPIGIFGTIWAHIRLREISAKDVSKGMDWAGVVLFSSGLTLLLLSLSFLSYGTVGSLEGIGFLVVGAILIVIFVIMQTKIVNPLLDLKLFKIKLFAAGNLVQLLNTLVWSGTLILLSLYLQVGLGETPLQAGIGILPLEIIYIIFSLLGARLSDRYGSRILCTVGLSIFTGSLFLTSTLNASSNYSLVLVVLLLIGIGNGIFNAPNQSAIMGSVPFDRRGIAAAFRQTMFNSGSTCGSGLVILFITFAIPYNILSQLLQNTSIHEINLLARAEFLHGVQIAAVLFAIIEALAVFPSALRGSSTQTTPLAKIETSSSEL